MMNYYQKCLYQIRDQKVADREVIKTNKNEKLIRINGKSKNGFEKQQN